MDVECTCEMELPATMTQSRTVSVQVHSTEDFSTWPPEIYRIYCALGLTLPSWCAAGPYHSLSTLLAELPRQPSSLYAGSCDAEENHLADVFNMVLSTVADIRSLVAQYGASRSVVPFLSSLMRVLAHMCAKEATIM